MSASNGAQQTPYLCSLGTGRFYALSHFSDLIM